LAPTRSNFHPVLRDDGRAGCRVRRKQRWLWARWQRHQHHHDARIHHHHTVGDHHNVDDRVAYGVCKYPLILV
jgi:hypothetical protein